MPLLNLATLVFVLFAASSLQATIQLLPDSATPADRAAAFPWVTSSGAAPIVLPDNPPAVVIQAATDLADDIARVTGQRPQVMSAADASGFPRCVKIVLAPDLAGRWETFRLSATSSELIVAGSDRRALAYGLYELSRRIGVSPWHWWADVPVAPRGELHLSCGAEPPDAPAVRYRGIFLNDEGWGLEPWARLTHEPAVGNIGPRTYARLFELLLRLRANTLWPAMHPCTIPFHQVPGNAATADHYAIILGSSHAEPMLRNNVGEWTDPKETYNYLTNRDGVLAYWEDRVRSRTSGESLFTLGMRGIHDSPIVGPRDQAERIATLERIFADQRALLARHLGDGDPTRVAQIFVPYKEVLSDYEAGLRVPADVTLVWPDDNFGYIRRFATADERARPGGLGVYYHLSYLGAPLSWLWVDSLPLPLTWTEMHRAYEQGAQRFWIANVGDLKNTELSTEFFLDLAWHADRTAPEAADRFLDHVAARDFGPDLASVISDLWRRHQRLAFARKPEHLQWHLPLTPYAPTALTEGEIEARLAAYADLDRDTAALGERLPAQAQDAYFQLVAYPLRVTTAANQRYFHAELARLQRARGDAKANATFDQVELANQRIEALTTRYNEHVAGGKWRHIVTINGLSPRTWVRYQPTPGLPPLNSDAQNAVVAAPPAPRPTPLVAPPGAVPGDLVESDGVVSLHPGRFAARADTLGGGWRVVPGLGRSATAVTPLPTTLEFPADRAPRLTYRFYADRGGPAVVRLRLLPTHPITPGRGLRVAVALDNRPAVEGALHDGFDPRSDAWKQRVLANAAELAIPLPEPITPGWHLLNLVAVDPGVVVDKIVIDFGGLRPSYDGPAETRIP